MARTEFSRKTKQKSLERSGYRCEATGKRYGFEEGQRCNAHLSLGVQFDHVLPCEFDGGNDLSNCAAICIQCHKYATRNDIRQIRKSDRQADKHTGVVRPAGKIRSAGFPKTEKAAKRQQKPSLQPKQLYSEEQA